MCNVLLVKQANNEHANVSVDLRNVPVFFCCSLFNQRLFFPFVHVTCSKKKRCVIYGKWTECMWSVDPQVYEAHRKFDKKGTTDTRKQKQVGKIILDSCFR